MNRLGSTKPSQFNCARTPFRRVTVSIAFAGFLNRTVREGEKVPCNVIAQGVLHLVCVELCVFCWVDGIVSTGGFWC